MIETETYSNFAINASMDSGSASGVGGRRSAMGDAASNVLTFRRPPGMTERRVIQGIGCHAVTSVKSKVTTLTRRPNPTPTCIECLEQRPHFATSIKSTTLPHPCHSGRSPHNDTVRFNHNITLNRDSRFPKPTRNPPPHL